MLAPAVNKRIPQLTEAPTYGGLGSLYAVVYSVITGKTHRYKMDSAQVGLVSNTIRGAAKVVRFRSSLLFGVPAGASTLDRLSPVALCVGNVATVLNPAETPTTVSKPPKRYALAIVPAGTAGAVEVAIDADPGTTATAPCKWVDFENIELGVLEYFTPTPEGGEYRAGTTVKFLNETVRGYEATQLLVASAYPGGQIPSPSSPNGATLWKEIFFSPLEHTQNTDRGTTGRVFTIALDSQNQEQGEQRTMLGFGAAQGDAPAMLAWKWQNADSTPAGVLELCPAYDATPGAANQWGPVVADIDESNLAHLAGAETITGPKTFTAPVNIQVGEPGNGQSLTAKSDIIIGPGAALFLGSYNYGAHYIGFHPAFSRLGIGHGGFRTVFDSTGNVGFGVENPTEKLDVAGKVKADEYLLGAKSFAKVQYPAQYPGGGINYSDSDLLINPSDNYKTVRLRAAYFEFLAHGTNKKFVIDNAGSAFADGNLTAAKFIGDGSLLTGVTINEANLVHRTGPESIGGAKTFTEALAVVSASATGTVSATSVSGAASISMGSFLAPNATRDVYMSVGQALQVGQAALIGYSQGSAFIAIYGRPTSDFLINGSGLIGMGTASPGEKLDVVGKVRATGFIGSGTELTGLVPFNSPSFQGYPSAPTQSPSTLGSYLATLDYVQQAFSGTAARMMGVSYDGSIVVNSASANQFNVTGGRGVVIVNRNIIAAQAFFGGSSDIDLNGFRYECIALGFHLYGGTKIFRNGTILGNIVARAGANVAPLEIYGGSIVGQFETAGDTANPIYILDNVRVYPRQTGLLPVNLNNAPCKFILRNGSKFIGCFPGSNAVVIDETQRIGGGQIVTFGATLDYGPLAAAAGTFTVDAAGAVVGKEVRAYLPAGAGEIVIPASGFYKDGGAFITGQRHRYIFSVERDGLIHYIVTAY